MKILSKLQFFKYVISGAGFLISGGVAGSTLDIVELYNLEKMTSCVVNVKLDIPRQRSYSKGYDSK